MRIVLATAGSRGDVEPFLALGEHARAQGHEVLLVAPDSPELRTATVEVASLGVDYARIIQAQGVSPIAAVRSFRTVVRPLMHAVVVGSARAALAFAPDVVVHHPKILSAPLVADALDVPHVLVETVPALTPTREFPAAGTTRRSLGPANRLTYRAGALAGAAFRADLDEVRALVGAAPGRPTSPPVATLMPISPAVLPRPRDWPETVHLTGPWQRELLPAPTPDVELEAFLDGGPFLYAGFGSMAAPGAPRRGRALVDAARRRGLRLLLTTGLGGLELHDDLRAPDVLARPSVPHAVVLPHATAAVHHGGIGTIQAATLAGTPSVIVPFIADQPFWGARLHRAGLSPAPLRRRTLSPAALSRALDGADRCRPRVEDAARAMRAEHGTASALAALTRTLA